MSETSGRPATRERIITATAELFRTQGFNGTSLKQVTNGAGAPIGSIYHFFPGGKDELGEAVLRESGAAYQTLFEMIAAESTDIIEAVGAMFEGCSRHAGGIRVHRHLSDRQHRPGGRQHPRQRPTRRRRRFRRLGDGDPDPP